RLDFKSNGPFNSEMGIEGHLIAGGLDASTQGTWRVESEGPVADLGVEVVSAHLHGLRPATTLPAAVRARLSLARGSAVITDLVGNIAGADLGGRLKIGLAEPATVDGDIELGEINLPAAIAAVIGAPVRASAAATVWPAEPFEQGLLGKLEGRVTVKMAHVTLTPMLAAKQVRGSVQFDQ